MGVRPPGERRGSGARLADRLWRMASKPPIPMDRIAEFCRKWGVAEFSLFGSILREDFRDDSDVDVLVAFVPGVKRGLDAWESMEDEVRGMFGREVDLVERRRVTNPFRRHEILTSRRVLYAA